MTTTELKNALIKYSPFSLKTDIETEERFSFTKDILLFNDKEIGEYIIRDEQTRFAVFLNGSTENKYHFELPLDYKDKPVILSLDNIVHSYLKEDQHNNTIPLIPKKDIADDEKAEL